MLSHLKKYFCYMKMCSLHDPALMCCELWRYLAQQPESQDLSQSQKIPWRSEDTLWGRSSCEEFCVSRHQIASEHYSKEKTQQPTPVTHLRCCTSSGQLWKGKNTQGCQCGMQPLQALCSSAAGKYQSREIPKHQLLLGATQCSQPLAVLLLLLLKPCWDKSR